jgi:hypothetical protein
MRRILLASAFTLAAGLAAPHAIAAEPVEVALVRFANVRAPNGAPGSWLEASVVLDVRPPAGTGGVVKMISRVHVDLQLGFELPASSGSERHVEYYRAGAECVALDAGRTEIRFYLPPELVKRDQLHGEPKFWTVDLSAGGRVLPPGRASSSATLANPENRRNFLTRAAAASPANDGLLQPQYLTVFANDYPRATPTFVRRDAR